ncbi:hypothetical protein G7074_06500 [Pedobacter sp. HDW13]|uniref:hypothetical protein n=1 Tax=Pedobacter sp. HDW13 TaxID=2714940 RepID=UPI00140E4F51|nr:hypothetical protein [Pedobacter sp. HDW13]QIL38963.1 hypothetical protein G7074_06500 [Pedobacter sp. HDW13]
MRKNYFMFLFYATIFMAVTISCKKQDAKPLLDTKLYNSKLREYTENVGIVHNEGLDYFLKGSKALTANDSVSGWQLGDGSNLVNDNSISKQVISFSIGYVNSNGGNEVPIPDAVEVLQSAVDNLTPTSVEDVWDDELSRLDDENLLTVREKNMVGQLKNIFSDGYNLNLNQADAKTYFENRLNTIQAQYQTVVFEENEGELYLGLLNLAKASNNYWHNSQELDNYDPTKLENPIIQLDLIGYIVGWTRAVIADYRAGSLNPSGQYRRIDKGIEYGLAASLTGWLKKIAPGDMEGIPKFNEILPLYDEPLSLPTPLPVTIMYWSSESELNDTVTDYSQDLEVFQNPLDNKYYANTNYTIIASDGFYFHSNNNGLIKIAKIINGSVVTIYRMIHPL